MELVGALVIGAAMGLLGGGGSILTVPVFVYAAGLDPKVAVAASLPVVAMTSASAAVSHWRMGNVQVRTALIYGVTAAVGSFAGARLATFLSGATQLLLLAVVMLAAAVRMLAANNADIPHGEQLLRINLATLLPTALGVGLLTGVVGVGGGFLIVPTLTILCKLPMRLAVGTSLMIIAMNTASGAAGYAGTVPVPWDVVLVFSAVAIVGTLAASRWSTRLPQSALRKGFGVLLVCLSVLLLVQNRHEFSRWLA
ncbi:MAG: sulfite exporter TauE/SafE family protein [Phycisphaerae bacterium]|nr:sulfite exporter TauE/SafE family protein [Gemmatimonadaceae bacterium]